MVSSLDWTLGLWTPVVNCQWAKNIPLQSVYNQASGAFSTHLQRGFWIDLYIYIVISIYCVNNVSNVIQESSNVTTLPIEHTSFQWPVLFSFLKLHWPYMDTIGFSWNILHIIGLSTGHSVLEIINWHGHRGRIDLAFFRWSTACSARLGIKDVWQMKRSYIWDIMEGILAESLEVTQAVLNLTVFLVTFATVEP